METPSKPPFALDISTYKVEQHARDSPRVIRLPDTLAKWPWPRIIDPHYEECERESVAWIESFNAFSPKAQAAFNKCDFNLLAAFAFAKLNKYGCRVGCDLMNFNFLFDEHSDVSDEHETRRQAEAQMDALRNPHKPRPEGEWIGGEVARQFWLNASKTVTYGASKRFIAGMDAYVYSVVQQASDRDHDHVRDVQSYFVLRRNTIGSLPSYAINEMHFNLPDWVLEHPIIEQLTLHSTDMIIIGNDLYSYNVEQSRRDDGHNLVTVVMSESNLGIQEAIGWIGRLHDNVAERFLQQYNLLPSLYGDDRKFNQEILSYADALANWVRANDQWSFESERYFGKDGLRVLKERTVALLPRFS